MSAAVALAFASLQCPPDSFSPRVIVPVWEFGLGQPQGGWLIRGWASPTPLPVSDMEVMRAQGLYCDPAQPLDTNRNNWAAGPGLDRGVMDKGDRKSPHGVRCSCSTSALIAAVSAALWLLNALFYSAQCVGDVFFETETMLGNDWHEVNFRQAAAPEIVV